jgi:hypothetical protein
MAMVTEVWAALENQFSGKSNKMQAIRIMHELTNLKQGSMSVTGYSNNVRRLYRDLHYYHPFEPIDKKYIAIHHTWFQSFVSKLFLDGLNQDFDLHHQLIFSKSEWPSLDDIISSIIEEETILGNPKMDDQRGFDATTALSLQKGRAFNQGKKKYFVRSANVMVTQLIDALRYMVIYLGRKKKDINQEEHMVENGVRQTTQNLKGSFQW